MTDDPDFERAARESLADGPDQTPPATIEAVLLAVRTTPQERDLWTILGSGLGRLAVTIAAIVVVVAGAGAFNLLADRGGAGAPSSSPSPSASAAAVATDLPSTSPSLPSLDVATWVDFTSARFGISAKFPPGWTVTAATAPWIGQLHDPGPEISQDPFARPSVASDSAISTARMGFFITSQAIPRGMTEAAWLNAYAGADVCPQCTPGKVPGPSSACFPKPPDYVHVIVDGLRGYEHGGLPSCNFTEVLVLVGGRAYQLAAYVNVEHWQPGSVFDHALFDTWLSTIHFDPAGANDTPLPSPAAS